MTLNCCFPIRLFKKYIIYTLLRVVTCTCFNSCNMIKSPAHLKVLLHLGAIKMVVCSVISKFFAIILIIFSCHVSLEPKKFLT